MHPQRITNPPLHGADAVHHISAKHNRVASTQQDGPFDLGRVEVKEFTTGEVIAQSHGKGDCTSVMVRGKRRPVFGAILACIDLVATGVKSTETLTMISRIQVAAISCRQSSAT